MLVEGTFVEVSLGVAGRVTKGVCLPLLEVYKSAWIPGLAPLTRDSVTREGMPTDAEVLELVKWCRQFPPCRKATRRIMETGGDLGQYLVGLLNSTKNPIESLHNKTGTVSSSLHCSVFRVSNRPRLSAVHGTFYSSHSDLRCLWQSPLHPSLLSTTHEEFFCESSIYLTRVFR